MFGAVFSVGGQVREQPQTLNPYKVIMGMPTSMARLNLDSFVGMLIPFGIMGMHVHLLFVGLHCSGADVG